MTGVTVEELVRQVEDLSVEKVYEKLRETGIVVSKPDYVLTEEQRANLLRKLNIAGISNTEKKKLDRPKQISLKRRKTSEIEITHPSGRKAKIPVVEKKRRVYVRKDISEEKATEKPIDEVQNDVNSQATEAPSSPPPTAIEQVATNIEEPKTEVPEVQVAAPATENIEVEKAPVEKPKPQTSEPKKEKPEAKEDSKQSKKPADSSDSRRGKKQGKKSGQRGDSAGDKGDYAKTNRRKAREQVAAAFSDDDIAPARRRSRKSRGQKSNMSSVSNVQQHAFAKPSAPVIKDIPVAETITVAELAQKMSVKAADLIKALIKMGVMATINQVIDQDTACLAIEEMGHKARPIKDNSIEDVLDFEYKTDVVARAPIVTVMGHVDHGKTSLLDYIKRTKVTAKEAGGITQHIGAYHVKTDRGNLTFLDTPGHAAFTAMRARGAKCTDIVILIVAADDGVMPQTVEAINHAKAAGVPIVVAINKVDKPEADLEKVKSDLSQHELIPEDWGGDIMFIPLSAKEGTGVDQLIEAILLQSELLELKAAADGPAKGVVLEARLDKGRGPVASFLVQSGRLHSGDMLLAGLEFGRVKAMTNESGATLSEAGPSIPVEVLGLSGVPQAGDEFTVVRDEKKAREIALYRQGKHRDIKFSRQQSSQLDGFLDRMQHSDIKTLNVVLKADVQGSAEAIVESLVKLSDDNINVKIVSSGVGALNESDINLAMASQGVVIGFNVRADSTARKIAQNEGIELNYYSVIYDVIDGVKSAIEGRLGPSYVDKIVGIARVKDVFRSAKIGAIAGCDVIEGTVKKGKPIRVLRDSVVIYEGELESLRRFKDDVTEVKNGLECGIGVKNYNDVKVGDEIEIYETVEVKRGQ